MTSPTTVQHTMGVTTRRILSLPQLIVAFFACFFVKFGGREIGFQAYLLHRVAVVRNAPPTDSLSHTSQAQGASDFAPGVTLLGTMTAASDTERVDTLSFFLTIQFSFLIVNDQQTFSNQEQASRCPIGPTKMLHRYCINCDSGRCNGSYKIFATSKDNFE